MKKFGIRAELNVWILTFIAIFSIAQVICLLYVSMLNNEKNEEIEENVTSHISTCIENKIEGINKIQTSLLTNDKLITFLKTKDQNAFSDLLIDVHKIQPLNVDIIYAMIIDKNGDTHNLTTISQEEQQRIKEVYSEYTTRKNNGNLSDVDFFDVKSYSHNFTYLCNFAQVKTFDYEKYTNKILGTLIVCAKVDTRNFLQFSEYDNMVDLDLNSDYRSIKLISNADKYKIGETLTIASNKINAADWKMEGKIYLGKKNTQLYRFRIIFLLELFIILIFGFIWQFMLSARIAKPLRNIMEYLRGWNMVEKIEPLEVKGNRDIEIFAGNINDMLERNRDLARDLVNNQQTLYDFEIAKKEALIYAIQNQVNPHFLYNILELIRSIAVVYDVNEIENISVNVASIFRYNLNDNLKVCLSDEIDVAKKYLYIARQRFGEVFDVRFDIPDELLEEKIIKMVLQPILENSFNHGIGDFGRRFVIVVKARIIDDNIEISVIDNGMGIDKEMVKEMNDKFTINEFFSKRKIGLANLNNRLKLSYGSAGKLTVYSKKNYYTKIVLLIHRDKNQ